VEQCWTRGEARSNETARVSVTRNYRFSIACISRFSIACISRLVPAIVALDVLDRFAVPLNTPLSDLIVGEVVSGTRTVMQICPGGYLSGNNLLNLGGWGSGHSFDVRIDLARGAVLVAAARGIGLGGLIDHLFPRYSVTPWVQPPVIPRPVLPASHYVGTYANSSMTYIVAESPEGDGLSVTAHGSLYWGTLTDVFRPVDQGNFVRSSIDDRNEFRRIRFVTESGQLDTPAVALNVDERWALKHDGAPTAPNRRDDWSSP